MKIISSLTAILLAVALTACSDTPGETKLKQLLQQQYDARYAGLMDINDVKKLNGWSDSDKHYTAEVAYNIAFKKSFAAFMNEQTEQPGNPLEKMVTGMSAGMLKLQYGDFKAGDKYQVKQQTLTLRMTENGWMLTN
ncbi:hypothetical protein SAMN05660691_01481 [Rheinheimera pacifica]|uniref:Uncharacterized protein n=1 Tax=Rheinheimera pacifica TaxID=173990 RepID=A0A1H6L5U1_9GAMM|nr:hypothetical protein [Rheinheimera pacifica]SEH79551.1 hypothetical protein SAMN05660691_01481 [Rheinheimera pacifica]